MSESLQRNAGGQRNTGLDLLRLLAICMVIVLHYNYFRMGGLLGAVAPKETNYYLGQTTETFSIIACNLFVLISAYYLSAANRVKVRKVVDIGLMLVFYGLLCLAVAYAFGLAPTEATGSDLMKSILNRWFVVTYVILYLIFPFLNRVIRSISRRKHLYLIWLAFIFFSVWPSVYTKVTVSDKGYGITNFILLYLIAAYIRRYADGRKRWGVLIPAYLGSVALTLLIQLYPSYAEGSFRDFMDFVFMGKAMSYNFFLNVVSSVLLFLIFKNLSLRQSRAVSKLQGFSLSVYVIHENIFLRQWLYRVVFRSTEYYHSPVMLAHLVVTVLGIFVLCAAVETLRRLLFRYTVDPLISRVHWMNLTYTA